ncbi:MAG TPA: hypothetical protein VMD53_19400 [Rhizomicrobium sp.]|nr:hypothetical protein [Rhizomicrobium sp.]
MLFGLTRRSYGKKSKREALVLASAAQLALETAQRERMPLASVAERQGQARAVHWFATSILDNVIVQRRRPGETQNTNLTKDVRTGLTLTDDVAALKAAGENEPAFVELTLSRKEFIRYLRWARTVR